MQFSIDNFFDIVNHQYVSARHLTVLKTLHYFTYMVGVQSKHNYLYH